MMNPQLPKLIIVDDHAGLLESLKLALEDEYETATAKNGRECLHLLKTFNPDMVMTDYRMPGMDGMQLAEQLLQHKPTLAIVLYSAYLEPDVLSQAKQLGIKECIRKPCDIHVLSQKLALALK